MSVVKDAITAIRDALKLADDVRRVGDTLKELTGELRDHDLRLTRLEARLDTMIEITQVRSRSGCFLSPLSPRYMLRNWGIENYLQHAILKHSRGLHQIFRNSLHTCYEAGSSLD